MSRFWKAGGNPLSPARHFRLPDAPSGPTLTGVAHSVGNVSVNQISAAKFSVTKTGTADFVSNCSAPASEALTGDFALRILPGQNNLVFTVGLSASPLASDNENLDIALTFKATGNVSEGTSTNYPGSGPYIDPTPYDASTYWFIWRVGNLVKIGKGGTDIASTTQVGSTNWTQSGTVYFDNSIYSVGATFTVERLS